MSTPHKPPSAPAPEGLKDYSQEHCVLLIDDNEIDFLLTQEIVNLVKHGNSRYQLYWEPNGDRALQSMMNNEYDLYLLDYNIGQWNGIDLLKKSNQRCDNPIIMLTDHDQFDVDHEAMNLGAWDFILKRDLSPKRMERALRYANKRKSIMDDLKLQACVDELTGLPNRRYFNSQLNELITSSLRHNHDLCLCVCDIDHFKAINDKYGHAAGDAALKHFSQIVQRTLRNEDAVARFGGDEFAILFPHIDREGVLACIQRILDALTHQAVTFEHHTFKLQCSFGITQLQPRMTRQDLFNQADQALYVAKHRGRNQAHIQPLLPSYSLEPQLKEDS